MTQEKRHFAKSVTWRILASSATFLTCWLITGKIEYVVSIGVVDALLKLFLYYFHERLWYKSNYGMVKAGAK